MGNSQYIDKEKCYEVKVEFMTKKQKEKKDEILKDFEEVKLVDDVEVVVNKEDYYKVDFRQSIYVPKTLNEIEVDYVMKHVHDDKKNRTKDDFEYPELTEFAKTKVKRIICLYLNNKITTDRKQKIDMTKCVYQTPMFEFIYEKNSFFEGLAKKTVYTLKKLHRNFFKMIAQYLGLAPLLNAVTSLQEGSKTGAITALFSKKMISLASSAILGQNMYVGGLSLILRIFFPFAAPIIYLLRLGTG